MADRVLLVDQDGVLADFDTPLFDAIRSHFPDQPDPGSLHRVEHKITPHYPDEVQQEIRQIYREPNFYRRLPVMPSAHEAMKALEQAGWLVSVCTSPPRNAPYAASEKIQWLEDHFGAAFAQRAIITRDKTLVRGTYLIDDKPDVTGAMTPTWRQLVYRAPFNTDHADAIDWRDQASWQWLLEAT